MKLKEKELWILAALTDGPKYWHTIRAWVREQSENRVKFSAAAMVENIHSLLEKDLIQRDGEQKIEGGEWRTFYSIKENGTRVFQENLREPGQIGGLALDFPSSVVAAEYETARGLVSH